MIYDMYRHSDLLIAIWLAVAGRVTDQLWLRKEEIFKRSPARCGLHLERQVGLKLICQPSM
jgi:hypothetical protein